MEWNARTPFLWDWENVEAFNDKVSEIPKQMHSTDCGQGVRAMDTTSVHSSGEGGCSGSELGNGSSCKSSISASMDSSSNPGGLKSEIKFHTVAGCIKNCSGKKQLQQAEETESSPDLVPSVCSHEPMIGLKLGKRTYFEDVCAGNNAKTTSLSVVTAPSTTSIKKTRASSHNTQNLCCQVEGCNFNLASAKEYHRRHRVCETHSKCPKVTVAGLERRFCQQCSRFHDLSEFDGKKRSCRRRLFDHNARRRKPQLNTISFNATSYDDRQQIHFSLNRIPVHGKPTTDYLWGDRRDFKVAPGSWTRNPKDGQLLPPGVQLPNTTPHHDFDRLLFAKGYAAGVLNGGLETSEIASNLDSLPDFRCALSLLSSNTWCLDDSEHAAMDQLVHTSPMQPALPAAHRSLLGNSECWPAEQSMAESQVPPLALDGNNSQFQGIHLFKAPCGPAFFSNHNTP